MAWKLLQPDTAVASRRNRTPLPSSEPPSAQGAARRIEELHDRGEALDAVLRRANRVTLTPVRGRRPVALVVDDVSENRELYAIGLAACGFDVHTAADGADAVASALALLPDVIVLDFAMPGMDGGEAARRLAADERTRAIPIVMLSAFADLVPRDVRLGCAAFLAKPCLAEDLAALLRLIVATRAEASPRGLDRS